MSESTKLTRRTFARAAAAAPFIASAPQGALRARLKVDTERVIGDIDPLHPSPTFSA